MNTDPAAWLLFVSTLPASNPTARMRVWRGMKALGCAALRDGNHLLPYSSERWYQLRRYADETRHEGGSAWVLKVAGDSGKDDAQFRALFDRSAQYAELQAEIGAARQAIAAMPAPELGKTLRRFRRALDDLRAIDFFPSDAAHSCNRSWMDFVQLAEAALSPGEPGGSEARIEARSLDDFAGRTWATRKRLWVDRVASAWLIRRFIDPAARFAWIDTPAQCPPGAAGFDFDGAMFTHVGELVTFEVLLRSFGLESHPGLGRIGAMVHALDVGGGMVPESVGFESMMHGARRRGVGDDQLLQEVSGVLDSLYAYFSSDGKEEGA